MIVVADLYQLGRFNGNSFDKNDGKKLIRKGAKITEEYFEMVNANWEDRGKLYIKDEEATKKYFEDSAKAVQEKNDKKAKKDAISNSILAEIIEEAPKRRKRGPNKAK